jgi:putative glutamine amidotransferase
MVWRKRELPRIAIPMPHASDSTYAERAIPQYERAVTLAGGEPVRIALDRRAPDTMKVMDSCYGVLLPGSKADVDPARFHAVRSPKAAAADPRRDEVDNLLLDNAYQLRKPVLGICYGLQSLNVYRAGRLIQHIPDFLPGETRTKVNHESGGKVLVAHTVDIDSESLLGQILCRDGGRPQLSVGSEVLKITLSVNSSHHQSADTVGDGLRVSARCPDDDIIEALEGTASDHFVLAVQWHPERSVDQDKASRQIFRAFVEAVADLDR